MAKYSKISKFSFLFSSKRILIAAIFFQIFNGAQLVCDLACKNSSLVEVETNVFEIWHSFLCFFHFNFPKMFQININFNVFQRNYAEKYLKN